MKYNNWKYVKLGDVLFYQEGPGVRNSQYTTSGIKLLNVANLRNGTVDLSTSERFISEEEANGRYSHFLVDEGDLIIASSGITIKTFENKMGFIDKSHLPLCMNTSTIRFKSLDDSKLNIRFFMYFLKSLYFKNQIGRMITGSVILNFGPSHLKKILIPLPPLSQQQEIVQLLDKAGEMIELRKKQLATLDTLAESVFYQMFGDPVTNEKGWEMKRLGEFASVITGPFGSMLHVYDYIDGGVPLINPMHIVGNKIKKNNQFSISQEKANELIKYVLEINDIIMARRGEIGRCAVVGQNENGYLCGTGSLRIRPIDLPSTYLHYFIQTTYSIDYLKNNAKGATMLNLNSKIVKNMPILLPPLALQQEFAAIVEKIEEEKALAQTALKQSEDLFQRLMQDLFPSPSSQASVVERNHLEAVQTTI